MTVTVPTASNVFQINELARSLGIVLTSWQLDVLDRVMDDKKEASK